MVIGRSGIDLFLVPISSQLAKTEFALSDWRGAGLNVPCGIKAQIATIDEALVVRTVGTLSAPDQKMIADRLRVWLQL